MENQINNLLNAALRGNWQAAPRLAAALIDAAKKEGKRELAARLQTSLDDYCAFAGGDRLATLDSAPHPLADIFTPGQPRILDPKEASVSL